MTTSSPSISNGVCSATPTPAAELGRLRQPGAGQQQRELVAAEARDQPGLADDLLQARAELRQQPVAGVVAERVVELLEAVEVDHRDRQRRVVAAAELAVEALVEEPAVREPGQLVGQRQLAARVQRGVLDEGQRHPAEHGDERGGGEPDRRVDGAVEVVGDEQPAGDEREQRGRDERAPAVERDPARRRAPGSTRRAAISERRGDPEQRHAQRLDRPVEPATNVAGVADDAREQARGEQQPHRAHAPAAQRHARRRP